jgi:hypothetical protein
MTELKWLLTFMKEHKLSSSAKDAIIDRIGFIEEKLSQSPSRPVVNFGPVQAPSTQRLLNEMELQTGSAVITGPIAQTPTAAAALQAREQAIKIAASGKPEPGRTSPRKF